MKICPKCYVQHEKTGTFCSRKCANSRGPRSDDFKKRVSATLRGRKQTEERRLKTSGSLNGSWKGGISRPRVIKKCTQCKDEFTGQSKTIYCSQECWKKACSDKKTEFERYRKQCQFLFNVYDYPDWFNLTLIDEHGWYAAKNRGNNQKGVQRDHRLSIADGFKNNIEPRIISHPANCELKHDFANQRKRAKSSVDIHTLLNDIERWSNTYK